VTINHAVEDLHAGESASLRRGKTDDIESVAHNQHTCPAKISRAYRPAAIHLNDTPSTTTIANTGAISRQFALGNSLTRCAHVALTLMISINHSRLSAKHSAERSITCQRASIAYLLIYSHGTQQRKGKGYWQS
jgi:hypothetical protein